MIINNKGGKKIRQMREKIDLAPRHNIAEAIKFLQQNKIAKFDETVELIVNLGINAASTDQTVRGVAQMPSGTGKKIRVAVLTSEKYEEKALKAGADLVGLQDIIDDIKAGKINFDVCIATPDVIPAVSAIARILGPKGLMPNPKLGTVTVDVETAVMQAKSGQVEFRADKAGIIHVGVGKLSFTLDQLIANVRTLIDALGKAKPSSVKGSYLKEIFIKSTMSVALKVELSSIGN